jgi:4-diphosphocytidyl-2C-methyl-D-erythritol kinase
MRNDFHDAIAGSTPEIARAAEALRAAGAGNALLAGSGSCVFALTRRSDQAHDVAAALGLPETYRHFVTAFAATPGWRA